MFGCEHFTPNFSGFFLYRKLRRKLSINIYDNRKAAQNRKVRGFAGICEKSIFPARRISFPIVQEEEIIGISEICI